ncbi:MAG: hypothetical protein JWQ20_903 [Conexibacter sp.]|nr:hypothetical protein [Conexibacter sp.]
MTRNAIAGAIAGLAMLAAPAVASAHRGHDDRGRHHGRHHHAKKAQVKDLPAGTVTSFTAGELTITLANGKSYSGLVDDRTILKCDTAAPQTPAVTARASRHGDDDPAGDDRGGDRGDQGAQGDDRNDDHGDDDVKRPDVAGRSHDDDDVDGPRDDNGEANGNGRCTTADLVAGAKVTDADLSLKNGGTWKKVELLK